MGFPIRKSTDQSLFAAPHGLSQRITSFIACVCQGIHQMPLFHLIIPIAHDHRVEARSRRTLTECPSALSADWRSQSDDLAVYGAHILRCPLHKPSVVLHSGVLAPQRERRHDRCPRKLVRVCRAVQGLVGPARSFHSRTNVVCSSNIANMKDVQSVHVLQRCSSCQSRRCRQN